MKLYLKIAFFSICFQTAGFCMEDDFDTHSRSTTSQAGVARDITNEVKDCTNDMKQGWANGFAEGGVYGAIYGGAKAGIDCVTNQVNNFDPDQGGPGRAGVAK